MRSSTKFKISGAINLLRSVIITSAGCLILFPVQVNGQALNKGLHENLFAGPEFINKVLSTPTDKSLPPPANDVIITFEATTKVRHTSSENNYISIKFGQGNKSICFLDAKGQDNTEIKKDITIKEDTIINNINNELIIKRDTIINERQVFNCDGMFEKVIINGEGFECMSATERQFVYQIAKTLIDGYVTDELNKSCWKLSEHDAEIDWATNLYDYDVIREYVIINNSFYFMNGQLEKIDINTDKVKMYLTRDPARLPKYIEKYFRQVENYLLPHIYDYISKRAEKFPAFNNSKTFAHLETKRTASKSKKLSKKFLSFSDNGGLGINRGLHEKLFTGPEHATLAMTTPDDHSLPPMPDKGTNIYFCASTPNKKYGPDSNLVSIVFKDFPSSTGFFRNSERTIEFIDAIDNYKKYIYDDGNTNCDGVYEKVIINGILYECYSDIDKMLITDIARRLISYYVSQKLTRITNQIKYNNTDSLDWFTNITNEKIAEGKKEILIVDGIYYYENGILKKISYYSDNDHITYFVLSRNPGVLPKFIENYFLQIEDKIGFLVLNYTVQNKNFEGTLTRENFMRYVYKQIMTGILRDD